jgi:putative transcriptional regulator
VPIVWGGPVEPDRGTVVTRAAIRDSEGRALGDGVAVSQSLPTLVRLLRDQAEFMLCLGHAGWQAGQLDQEVEQGSWLFTELSAALLFEVPPEERYDEALASLGLSAKTMWGPPVSE